jgi:hypothetical protein
MPCLPSLTASKMDSPPRVARAGELVGALDFLKKDLVAMNHVCAEAGWKVPASKVLSHPPAR